MASDEQARRLMSMQQRVQGKHASLDHLKSLDSKKVKAFETLLRAGINPMDGTRRLRKFGSAR